jgi:putative SOS response-associated peptidase YedK
MCGRYTITADAKELEARFQAYVPPGLLAPSYNAAPTQGLPTILNANPYLITVSVWGFRPGLLLDSRVVELSMASNPTFVILSSLKPLFFNSLQNELPFSDNVGASAPGIQ